MNAQGSPVGEAADASADPLAAPVFVVGPPGSGHELLFTSLRRAFGTWGTAALDDELLVRPEDGHARSDRLIASDAVGSAGALRAALLGVYATRDRSKVPVDALPRLVNAGVAQALRIPFLDAVFPDARFVYLRLDPAVAVRAALGDWRSQARVRVPAPEGWGGPAWTGPLVPGWADLAGLPLEEVVARQWETVARTALNDLDAVPEERRRVVDVVQLTAHPEAGLQEVFDFLDIGWHAPSSGPWRERRDADPPPAGDLGELVPPAGAAALSAVDLRARDQVRDVDVSRSFEKGDTGRAVDAGLGAVLDDLGTSLLVSTYQSNRLMVMSSDGGALDVKARTFDRPMGVALTPTGVALGGQAEVWDFRDFKPAAAKLAPEGRHDACLLPRNRHVTGDIAVHDLEVGTDGLWLVATKFSCLATLDDAHSFVPRWKPRFISRLAPQDRCHLNGMAMRDGVPAYVTALGATDTPAGWRARKADGGILIDVASGETITAGLSMPHSPRWHDGRLWVLESGQGRLSVVDPSSGTTTPVVRLPGFTRGLRFHGDIAFVGTSEIRETATFGGLPISRLPRLWCGVWAVDVRTGELVGSMRFETRIQEVFDVAVLPGTRFPDVLEPSDPLARSTCHVPAVPGVTD